MLIKANTKRRFIVGQATHPGMSGKDNEDALVVFGVWLPAEIAGDKPISVQVAVVADGIGGSVAGERASQLAVAEIARVFTQQQSLSIDQRLEVAIQAANTKIEAEALANAALRGMGTTVVIGCIVAEQLIVAHVGDSRAYLIRNGIAHQLTVDHTWVQEAVDADLLTLGQAAQHPNRHVIKRYLGILDQVTVDRQVANIVAPAPGLPALAARQMVHSLPFQAGDTLLLCSDGLTDVVEDATIQKTVIEHPPQQAANKLIELANAAGGPDNITALLIQWPNGTVPSAGRVRGAQWLGLIGVLTLLLISAGIWGVLSILSGSTEPTATPVTVALATVPTSTSVVAISMPTPTTSPTTTPTPLPKTSPTVTAIPTSPPTPVPTNTPLITPAITSTMPIIPTSNLALSTTLSNATTSNVTLPSPSSPLTISLLVQATQTVTHTVPDVSLSEPERILSDTNQWRFKWTTAYRLQDQEYFEVVFWKPSKAPFAIEQQTPNYYIEVDLGALDDDVGSELEPGIYQWGVRLQPSGLMLNGSGVEFEYRR